MLRLDEAIRELTGGWIAFAGGRDVFRGLACVLIASGGYSGEPLTAAMCGLLPIRPDKAIKQVDRCFSMNIYTHTHHVNPVTCSHLTNRIKDSLPRIVSDEIYNAVFFPPFIFASVINNRELSTS